MRIPAREPGAMAYMRGGTEAPGLRGIVEFYDTAQGILITAEIFGLPENSSGFHGFHIHEGDNCTGEGFADAGGHYNPSGAQHPDHAGDLPPLLSRSGKAYLAVLTDRFQLQEVIGRTVVIHSDADDFHSQPAGNSGKKIGCGVILPHQERDGNWEYL